MKELCPFSSNIVKVRLCEQNGANVMSTNANDQRILIQTLKVNTELYF